MSRITSVRHSGWIARSRPTPLLSIVVAVTVLLTAAAVNAAPREHAPDELLVGFREGVTEGQAAAVYQGHGGVKLEKLLNLNVHRIRVAPEAMDAVQHALSQHPDVQFVEPNWRLAPEWTPNDPYFTSAWHLPKIGAPAAWDIPQKAQVIVAIVDSGVDPTQPDLASHLVPGYNFHDNNTQTADVTGHGTAVAGAAGAIGNNSLGVVGVAPLTRVMPMRTTDSTGYSYASAVTNAMTWASNHGARVINLSVGGVAGVSSITTAAQYVRSKGGVVVAAGGNCGCLDPTPENPYIISVSATTSLDTIASFSSRGNYIDISAPGQSIWTTNRGGTYGMWYGTSLASPVVAGVVALMMGANPGLTPATTEKLLKANADNLGTAGWDQIYGYGRVNAYRAVAAAAATATATATTTTASADSTSPTAAITSPTSGATVSGLRTVSIAASDNVGVSRVELYVDGALYGSDMTAAYSVSWDTTKVTNGTHSLVAKAYDAAGSQGVSPSVTVSVSNGDTTPPVTQITSVWTANRDLKASVAASDNVGVVTVQLYVDGVLYGTASSAPTTFSVRLKALSAGTHTLRSKAYDAAGNVGTSSGVSFTK